MMQATRVGARAFLAVVFLAHSGCSKDTPTSAQVELVGTLTITRMAKEVSLGEIWEEVGTADLSIKAELSQIKDGAMVVGSGTGKAKFDFARGICTEHAEWTTSYKVTGSLSTDPKCLLALQVDVTWTKGTSSIKCGGTTGNRQEADYTFSLPVIFENNAHEVHTTTKDGAMEWDNRYQMIRFDSTGVTRCQFNR